jgi:hypothetical protein
MAASARAMSSSAGSPGWAMVTPMLREAWTSCPSNADRRRGDLADLLGDLDRLVEVVHPGDQHEQLVAAHPRHHVVQPDGLGDPRGDGTQHRIAGGMAEQVVDVLEVVDIAEQQAELASRLAVAAGGLLEPMHGLASRHQSGDGVDPGLAVQFREGLDLDVHIAHRGADPVHSAGLIPEGRNVRLHPVVGAVIGADAGPPDQGLPLRCPLEHLVVGAQVEWMDEVAQLPAEPVGRGAAEHGGHRGGDPGNRAIAQVGDHVRGILRNQPIEALGCAHPLPGEVELGDVLELRDERGDPSVAVAIADRGMQGPDGVAIGSDQSLLPHWKLPHHPARRRRSSGRGCPRPPDAGCRRCHVA